jgi:hypothetical protein
MMIINYQFNGPFQERYFMFNAKLIPSFINGLLLASCVSAVASDSKESSDNSSPRRRSHIETCSDTDELTSNRPSKRKRRNRELDSHILEAGSEKEDVPAIRQEDQETDQGNDFMLHGRIFPTEVMLEIFNKLSLVDIARVSQVCKQWQQLCEEPQLWRSARDIIHGDYPESEATRENAKLHWVRVMVNSLSDIDAIEQLVRSYQLNRRYFFKDYSSLARSLPDRKDIIDERVAQGDKAAIEMKIKGVSFGFYDYGLNPKIVDALRKRLDELKSEESDPNKVEKRHNGWNSHELHPKTIEALKERLVKQAHKAADERKIRGLANGEDGYEKDPEAAVAFNESLIEQGDKAAMKRKIRGLYSGEYGYEENYQAANVLEDYLVLQGDKGAIKRKILRLGKERNIDKQTLSQMKILIEKEELKGRRWAYYIKAKGLKFGIFGFEKDPIAAIQYIKANGVPY